MISMPLSRTSCSSMSRIPARPPPKSCLKVAWKCWLIPESASKNFFLDVVSIRWIAFPVEATESSKS